jgi:hypothetical protein
VLKIEFNLDYNLLFVGVITNKPQRPRKGQERHPFLGYLKFIIAYECFKAQKRYSGWPDPNQSWGCAQKINII